MRNKNAKIPDISKMFTDPGQDEKIIYEGKLQKDGTVLLVEVGKESMQQMIDAWKEQTDMSWIIKNLEMGNTQVINRVPSCFGDFTEMPKTYAEVLQLRIDAQTAFEKLPVETKQKFNNNFNEWFMEAGEGEWFEKMNIKKDDPDPKSEGDDVNE